MPHKLIDTITLTGRKRRQIKSTGHNDMNAAKIKASREKAVEMEMSTPFEPGKDEQTIANT